MPDYHTEPTTFCAYIHKMIIRIQPPLLEWYHSLPDDAYKSNLRSIVGKQALTPVDKASWDDIPKVRYTKVPMDKLRLYKLT